MRISDFTPDKFIVDKNGNPVTLKQTRATRRNLGRIQYRAYKKHMKSNPAKGDNVNDV